MHALNNRFIRFSISASPRLKPEKEIKTNREAEKQKGVFKEKTEVVRESGVWERQRDCGIIWLDNEIYRGVGDQDFPLQKILS